MSPPKTEDVMGLDEILLNNACECKYGHCDVRERAKAQILANYTPNTEVEQQVLIGRLDELMKVEIYEDEYKTQEYLNKRTKKLDRQISKLTGGK